jgi:hypothetical protein
MLSVAWRQRTLTNGGEHHGRGNHMLATPAELDALRAVDKLSMPFFEIFSSVIDPRGGSRVPHAAAVFATTATLLEINDLLTSDVDPQVFWGEVFDSLFRGERNELERAFRAFEMNKLATTSKRLPKPGEQGLRAAVGRPAATNQVTFYRFQDAFLSLVRSYADRVSNMLRLSNAPLADEHWKGVAQLTFDFFRYRYGPEWYLLGRRLMRVIAQSYDERQVIRRKIFSDSTAWRPINHYIIWFLSEETSKRNFLGIREYFKTTLTDGNSIAARNMVDDLEAAQICRFVDGHNLVEDDRLVHIFHDYARHIRINYGAFCDFLRKFVEGELD